MFGRKKLRKRNEFLEKAYARAKAYRDTLIRDNRKLREEKQELRERLETMRDRMAGYQRLVAAFAEESSKLIPERYSIRYRPGSMKANAGRAWKATVDGNKSRYFHTEQEAQAWIGRRAMARPQQPTPEMEFDNEGNVV